MEDTRYLSAKDAAERLGLSLRTVRRRISDGSLPSVRVGGAVRIPVSALEPGATISGSHTAREAATPYTTQRESRDAYVRRWNRDHWPDTHDRMLERRRLAFADLEEAKKHTKPATGPHDTIDALLRQEREEFGTRLLPFIPERDKADA